MYAYIMMRIDNVGQQYIFLFQYGYISNPKRPAHIDSTKHNPPKITAAAILCFVFIL